MEYGLYMKHCKVEVYLLEFKICIHPNLNDIKKREFSRADTVGEQGSEYTLYGTLRIEIVIIVIIMYSVCVRNSPPPPPPPPS